MTLTEQWDKGKLPEGDYYIKRRNGDFLYDNIDTCGVWRNSIDEDILEVLAPVPSFKEWQKMKEQRDACAWALDKIGDVLVKHKLVEKIYNAIGEKKWNTKKDF